jgi:hypothetical protein
MNDTYPDITIRFQNLMMHKSGEQRLLMGCSMYDSARQIVRSAVYNKHPQITAGQMKKEIFIRFYGLEFNKVDREKIFSVLESS